jgi:hypothetical protein
VDRLEEVAHLLLLVHDVVTEKQPAGPQPRKHHVEKPLVVALPGVEEDEVERARELRQLLERVPGNDRDDVGEPGAAHVLRRGFRPGRIVFDRGERAAGLPQAKPYPDRAVTARRANFEGACRARGRDHHAEEAPVFFGHRELLPVRRLDLL